MLDALGRAANLLWVKLNSIPGSPPKPPAALKMATVIAPPSSLNALVGLPLRYLIGTDTYGPGRDNEIIEVSYDATTKPAKGTAVKYCNLFDEKNSGQYGPYLTTSDTAAEYHEGQIDPKGAGWTKNLTEQFARAVVQGFQYVELDNPDAYSVVDVLGAVSLAQRYGFKVIAKNPLLMSGDSTPYVAHPAVVGAIVERGAGSPVDMDALRKKAGKPNLPVWFIAFGDGRAWAGNTANAANQFAGMGVTYSDKGEYGSSIDLFRPNAGIVPAPMDTPVFSPSNEAAKTDMPPQAPIPIPVSTPLPDTSVKYASEYASDWKAMVIQQDRAVAVTSIAHKLIDFKPRYQAVEAKTGIPWYVIAVLHQRESDADFSTYLGNGEPLNRVTRLVPKGRGPFSTWEAGASDALSVDGLDKVKAWPIERIAYSCEKFNGFGYRTHGVPSAYLWSFSSIYKGGKYVSDGVWSSTAQDQQCGTMPMLRGMMDLDSSIQIGAARPPIIEPPKPILVSASLLDPYRIVGWMTAHNCTVDTSPKRVNIVYLEGVDLSGDPNNNERDKWNDVRLILQYDSSGKPHVIFQCAATTTPGTYYDVTHPLVSGGAALIAPGQQACWQVGIHHAGKADGHEALVQTGAECTVYRDIDKSFRRQPGHTTTGWYGINHHSTGGADASTSTVGYWSAGCLVARRYETDHKTFMRLVKSDERYLSNHQFVFSASVIPVEWQT